jgi:anaerobic selenocysteine-containing dehydrogenase
MCACRCGIKVHVRDGDGPLHRGQSGPPAQQGRDLREGLVGDHEAEFAGAADEAAARKKELRAGDGQFEEITWDEASSMLTERLARIRATDPKKFALFTGRDQMQALTGLVRAAVRHAELRGARRLLLGQHGRRNDLHDRRLVLGIRRPRLDHAKLFVMIGTGGRSSQQSAEDRAVEVQARAAALHLDQSDPHRLPAIADEWIPIRPGTDGACCWR